MIGFIKRLFGGQPKLPPINEDWKTGDLATPNESSKNLQQDGKWLVAAVYVGKEYPSGVPCWGLELVGLHAPVPCRGWMAKCFRKITPDAFEEPRRTDVRLPENVS